jgi:ubiquinone/menaquinone biosynthesis C-methylase UbiE
LGGKAVQDSKKRFSNRADYYAKYRPRYPETILTFMENELGFSPASVVADIGSGTGLLTEIFLRHGNSVFGVEPNEDMRKAAENFLSQYSKFTSVDGSAEATNLPAASVDFVTAAQAFHWFDQMKARREFSRILTPNGWVLLVWNSRRNSPGFMEAYERLVSEFGNQLHARRTAHDRVGEQALRDFFDKYKLKTFNNSQALDFEGLAGRLLSSSYVPLQNEPGYAPMMECLRKLFDCYQEGGLVRLEYETETYYGQLRP